MKSQTKLFIRNHFFQSNLAGHQCIADHLIDSGTCVVPGHGSIWIGGIGNFITRTAEQDLIGCTRLTFDKDAFLKSELYKSCVIHYIKELEDKKREIQEEIEAIYSSI
jgi:hypothetical protein